MISEVLLRGTPAEIGLERGKQLKFLLELASQHYVYGHSGQWSLRAATDFGRRLARDLGRRCPALLEEILFTAKGAALAEDIMLAFAFRSWNALCGNHPSTLACYNIGCRDPKRGPLVAGVLEDTPPFYLLEIIHPAAGIPFAGLTWAGLPWAVRTMNKAGLTIGQASSFAGTRFAPGRQRFPFDLYARAYYAERWAIQNATTVAEAIEIIRRFECTSVFMLADATGKLVILETCGKLHAIRRPDRQGQLTGGVFVSPNFIKALIDQGVAHDWECGVRLDKTVAAQLRAARGRTTIEWLAKYLRTDRTRGGWCHDLLQAATIACPATGEFWVSGYHPCTSGFKKYRLTDL